MEKELNLKRNNMGNTKYPGQAPTKKISDFDAFKSEDEQREDMTKEAESNVESSAKYAPFKMKAAAFGNSPMLKNFGVGQFGPQSQDGGLGNAVNQMLSALGGGISMKNVQEDTLQENPEVQKTDTSNTPQVPTPQSNAQKIDQLANEVGEQISTLEGGDGKDSDTKDILFGSNKPTGGTGGVSGKSSGGGGWKPFWMS